MPSPTHTGSARAQLPLDENTRAAFGWVEQQLGGTITSAYLQPRWARKQWFLDVDRSGAEPLRVVLRGRKSEAFGPGGRTGAGSPAVSSTAWNSPTSRLEREAAVLRALQGRPGIVVPRYHGYHHELGWLLQESVAEEGLLTDLGDERRQARLFRSYLDQLAAVHRLDLDDLQLGSAVPRPDSPDIALVDYLDLQVALYEAAAPAPDPLIEFTVWWLRNRKPAPSDQLSLCLGDVGANQFMFSGDDVCLMDFEMSRISNHFYDIGNIRLRTLVYNVPDLAEHIDYYCGKFGEPADIERIQYYTAVHLSGGLMLQYRARHDPDPRRDPGYNDYLQIWAYATSIARGLAELFMEIHGFRPELPELPEPDERRADIYNVLTHRVGLLEAFASEDHLHSFAVRGTAAVAETILRQQRLGRRFAEETADEISAVLGRRVDSVEDGLRLLTEAVVAAPERDLERRLQVMYRYQARQEHVFRPFHAAYGQHAMRRLDPLTSV
jgi:aminoglycoside phosphotransferase (APT) family kinase protein